ncbi:hypothetical protein GCM10028819_33560 [Spirosoma humi]
MKITSGPYEVLESGSVISFGDETLTFYLAEDFIITFKFLESDREKPLVSFDITDPGEITIQLENLHHKQGLGTGSPLYMGKLNDKALYLSFRTYNYPNRKSDTILHYTFYLGEEKLNG